MTSLRHSYRFILLTLASFTLTTCGKDGPTEPPAQVPSLITLSSQTVVLTAVGQTIQITATVMDQESKVIAGAAVTWTSSNPNVASVSPGGVVTAVSNGTARITATFGFASGSTSVSVAQEAGSISITPDSATLETVGATVQLEAMVYDTGGSAIPGATVVWSSNDPAVATVDANGLVTAVASGTALITATSGIVSESVSVSLVFALEAVSISINIKSLTLTSIGQGVQLEALVFDIDGAVIPDAMVIWSSGVPTVARVDESGFVTAFSNGTTRIIATSGSVSAFATIHVDLRGTGPAIDKAVLIAFYNATGGPDWMDDTNWVSNAPLQNWYGVITDSDGRVSELNLRENNLVGDIPTELRNLRNLTSLNLGLNRLTGGLPPELGQLSNLTSLWLDGNQLSGSIPSELGQLDKLEILNLGDNDLTGSIPPTLSQLSDLKILDFRDNDFTGGIPPQLGQLTSLERILLDNNRLTGIIPPELGRLNNLEYLILHHNQLTGGIPPELGRLENVVLFELHFNQLTGGVPSELGDLANMKSLELRNNRGMSGPLPSSLTNVNLSNLSLDSTQLCVPAETTFQAWLASIPTKTGVLSCSR